MPICLSICSVITLSIFWFLSLHKARNIFQETTPHGLLRHNRWVWWVRSSPRLRCAKSCLVSPQRKIRSRRRNVSAYAFPRARLSPERLIRVLPQSLTKNIRIDPIQGLQVRQFLAEVFL